MRKILVVDDNLPELNGLSKLLERSGFRVSTAANGLEALQQVQRETFDLLLSDVWMPRMTGVELLHHLPAEHRPKVILMTGDREIEGNLELLRCEYIIKPFHSHDLLELITRALLREDTAKTTGIS